MNPYTSIATILLALIVGVGQCYLPAARTDYNILTWMFYELVLLGVTFALLVFFFITAGGARFWLVYYPFIFIFTVNLSAWTTMFIQNWIRIRQQ